MIRKGSKVILLRPHYSFVRKKALPIGAQGTVRAIRMPGPDALVKFRGFQWPISLPVEKLIEADKL